MLLEVYFYPPVVLKRSFGDIFLLFLYFSFSLFLYSMRLSFEMDKSVSLQPKMLLLEMSLKSKEVIEFLLTFESFGQQDSRLITLLLQENQSLNLDLLNIPMIIPWKRRTWLSFQRTALKEQAEESSFHAEIEQLWEELQT